MGDQYSGKQWKNWKTCRKLSNFFFNWEKLFGITEYVLRILFLARLEKFLENYGKTSEKFWMFDKNFNEFLGNVRDVIRKNIDEILRKF